MYIFQSLHIFGEDQGSKNIHFHLMHLCSLENSTSRHNALVYRSLLVV